VRVKKAAVVGAGTMGRGIAQILAAAGIPVYLVDRDDAHVQQAIAGITETLDREIAKWGMTSAEKKSLLSRITGHHDLECIRDAEIVIEAIQEELAAKQELWTQLERLTPPEVLKISHTATLSITEIARPLTDPGRLIGLHFLPPAPKIPVVEIVRGLKTTDDTLHHTRELIETLGKTAVEVTEYPGFITARIVVPMLNEAMHALMEGVASAKDIDTAMRLGFGFEVGPLSLADRIGLDQVLKWMNNLSQELGDPKYRPCPLLRKMVRAGHLGVKSGRGFFDYVVE
jgi:3-hydroxybutyryl-CoA dehydrogenase